MELYFAGRSRKSYEQDISSVAIDIINEKPEKWEDKLFLEVFRQQRAYLDSLLKISLDSDLAKYVLIQKSEDTPAQYLMNMLNKIKTCGWDSLSSSVELFLDARGFNVPGNPEKIIEAARRFYDYYIFYIEMLYDIEFIYLPNGENIRAWFKAAIKSVLKEICFVMLDRMDLLVTKIINGDEIEEDFLCVDINKINLNLDAINEEMTRLLVTSYVDGRTTIHALPCDNDSSKHDALVLITIEEYNEYLKLKD